MSIAHLPPDQHTNGHSTSDETAAADVANVEAQIQNLLELLLEVGICTSDVQPNAIERHTGGADDDGYDDSTTAPGGLVGIKIRDSIDAMASLSRAHYEHPAARDLRIPNEVIEYVDQGRNPDIFSKEITERVAGENMYTNGIFAGIASYRDYLASEMKIAFPALSNAIDSVSSGQKSDAVTVNGASPSLEAITAAVKLEER